MTMPRGCAALAVAVALLGACAGFERAERAPATEEERSAFATAMAAVEGDPGVAEQRLAAFVATWPRSPLADDAAMELAKLEAARGDREAALAHYTFVIREHPDGNRTDAARVYAATIESARGNAGDAARIMGRTRLERLTPEERRLAYRVLADVLSDPVAQLRWLARLRAEEPDADAVALIDVEIDEIVRGLDGRGLARAARQIDAEIPAARIQVARAERALDAADLDEAREALDRAAELPIAPQYASRLRSARERLRMREEGPPDLTDLPTFAEVRSVRVPPTAEATGTIGVVLPLSGRFAHFGEEALQGILLAAGIFGDGEAAMRLEIRDSAGRPEHAAAAVRNLAQDENVVAVVGPLLASECEAAAQAAEEEGIPLVALTARAEVARDRPYVFRVRTMPVEEVHALVDHSMRDLGALTFAILYPRDAYGRALRDLFWDAVEVRGGEIVGVASYDPEATDFGDPIRRLVGYVLLTDEEKELVKERDAMRRRARRLPPEEAMALRDEALALTGPEGEPLPPIIDFDALFIPESHEKVVLIAPQLAFHEVTGTRLLGSNEWFAEDLLKIAGKHVEGALITAQYFPESPLPFVQDFEHRFETTFDQPPDAFAAQGFDAANLLLVQLADRRETRESLRDGMLTVRGYPGVTGILSMRADGNAHKRPFLLEIERGHFVEVD
jgi:branched-chain amino acid transport system substrate-binding protein